MELMGRGRWNLPYLGPGEGHKCPRGRVLAGHDGALHGEKVCLTLRPWTCNFPFPTPIHHLGLSSTPRNIF